MVANHPVLHDSDRIVRNSSRVFRACNMGSQKPKSLVPASLWRDATVIRVRLKGGGGFLAVGWWFILSSCGIICASSASLCSHHTITNGSCTEIGQNQQLFPSIHPNWLTAFLTFVGGCLWQLRSQDKQLILKLPQYLLLLDSPTARCCWFVILITNV